MTAVERPVYDGDEMDDLDSWIATHWDFETIRVVREAGRPVRVLNFATVQSTSTMASASTKPPLFIDTASGYPADAIRYVSKIVLLGESGVGKTQFAAALVAQRHEVVFKASMLKLTTTIGVDFKQIYRTIGLSHYRPFAAILFNVWDTAGNERLRQYVPSYTKNSDLMIVVYDVTRRETFETLADHWMPFVHTQMDINPGVVFMLIGNKADLTEQRRVSTDEGRAMAKKLCAHLFFEINVLRRELVHSAVDAAVPLVYEAIKENPDIDDDDRINLKKPGKKANTTANTRCCA